MSQIFDAFWRAVLYCLHPRVILLSLLPVLIAGTLACGLAYFYWEGAVADVRSAIEQWSLIGPISSWLSQVTGGAFLMVIGPLIVVALSVPVLLIASLLLVSAFMGGAVVNLVAARRFPTLMRLKGGSWWQSLIFTFAATLAALIVLLVTLPLWLIPPLALLLPPLIWGWLSYRVMSLDALSEHASGEERRAVMAQHRWQLLAIGVVTGYFGIAPSLVWAAAGVFALPFMPLLLPVFVWLYTLVFAFAALWFTHYALAALAQLRSRRDAAPPLLMPAVAAVASVVEPAPVPPDTPTTPTTPTPSPELP
jgi:MFS family permease